MWMDSLAEVQHHGKHTIELSIEERCEVPDFTPRGTRTGKLLQPDRAPDHYAGGETEWVSYKGLPVCR